MNSQKKLISSSFNKDNEIGQDDNNSSNYSKHYFLSITLKNKQTMFKHILTIMIAALLNANAFSQALTPVSSFGSNPGNLRMYSYVPTGVSGSVSLVVVLHGCTQTATSYAAASGWNKLADLHKFILVYPEQKKENNPSLCFNWFDSLYQKKDQLQVLSIKQMVDYMKSNYAIDTTKIFITGLSAGGAMANIMLANYPETFKKGAIMSGIPFKASNDTLGAYYSTHGFVIKTPAQWGALVKNVNPTYTGAYPDVALFHGGQDSTVYLSTNTESIKQWTNVNGADQIPDSINLSFQGDPGVSLIMYNDTLNKPVVYYYKIKNMKHAVSVDTGNCPRQGGQVQAYAKDFNLHSTYWAGKFFGILNAPYTITGSNVVFQNANAIVYSVPNTVGSTYNWSAPTGASIVSGQGSNTITVNFGTASGNISVVEITSNSCINDKAFKFVTVLDLNVVIKQTSFLKCFGDKNAQLTATVTGDNGPYTFNWLPGNKKTSVISNLGAGTYTLTVKNNSNAVVNTSTFTIVQPPLIVTNQSLTICAGESIQVGKSKYHKSGTYTNTLTANNGCDSVIKTVLTVLPEKTMTQIVEKCFGETHTVGTNTYSKTGRYTDIFTSVEGCDSTVITILVFSECTKNNNENISISIYPNPFSSIATIKFDKEQSNVKIAIIDWNGNQISSESFSGTIFQLDGEKLKKGNYTVLIIDNKNNVITENIMVK